MNANGLAILAPFNWTVLILSACAFFLGGCNETQQNALFYSVSDERFPSSPDTSLTPGDLCHVADSLRYPEQIKYCERSVSVGLKNSVMQEYDAVLGYQTTRMRRNLFKIDHYLPLCLGGSNDRSNLWPQHETVYQITDPLEEALCSEMTAGKLVQAEAISLIKRAKHNLDEVEEILARLERN